MAGKFVELKEAARAIGVTPEELVEMRSRGEIFGYRDGTSWKFKSEEVERVISERNAGGGASSILSADDQDFEAVLGGLSGKGTVDLDEPGGEHESILVTEESVGKSGLKTSSTVIGRVPTSPHDSDIQLAGEGPSSDVLQLGVGSDLSGKTQKAGSDVLGEMKLAEGGSATGDLKGGPSLGAHDHEADLSLGTEELHLDEDEDLSLRSSGELSGPAASGADDLNLSGDPLDDDESVLALDGGQSDLSLGTADSGINLAPSDSGLSLEEEPLDIGASLDESLELPEDEEVIALEEESADPDQATQLKADDQFLLSPSDALEEEESDSGSQVIALEDSESFDQDAATMLGKAGAVAESPLIAEDAFAPLGEGAAAASMGMGAPGMMGQPQYIPVQTVEAPYSIWNVLSLMLVTALMALGSMLMVDVMLNMWTFEGTANVSTSIMDSFINMLQLDR